MPIHSDRLNAHPLPNIRSSHDHGPHVQSQRKITSSNHRRHLSKCFIVPSHMYTGYLLIHKPAFLTAPSTLRNLALHPLPLLVRRQPRCARHR